MYQALRSEADWRSYNSGNDILDLPTSRFSRRVSNFARVHKFLMWQGGVEWELVALHWWWDCWRVSGKISIPVQYSATVSGAVRSEGVETLMGVEVSPGSLVSAMSLTSFLSIFHVIILNSVTSEINPAFYSWRDWGLEKVKDLPKVFWCGKIELLELLSIACVSFAL